MTEMMGSPPLLDVQYRGSGTAFFFADGYAEQEVHPRLEPVFENASDVWQALGRHSIKDVEARFQAAFAELAGSPGMARHPFARIAPTASIVIDITAAWLRGRRLRTAIVEPTFTTLARIFRRREVDIVGFRERTLHDAAESDALDQMARISQAGAIFLVNPGNPSGLRLSRLALTNLAAYCARHRKVLVLDNSCRLYHCGETIDDLGILTESGVEFLSFENTGKVWPTYHVKCSLVLASEKAFGEWDEIFAEIFGYTSPYNIALLAALAERTAQAGLRTVLWDDIAERRAFVRNALAKERLGPLPALVDTTQGVECVDCGALGVSGHQLAERALHRGVHVLPGNLMYWNSHASADAEVQGFVRIALLKPRPLLYRCVDVLAEEARRLVAGREN